MFLKIFGSILLVGIFTFIPLWIGKKANRGYFGFTDWWVDGIVIEFVIFFVSVVIFLGISAIWGNL